MNMQHGFTQRKFHRTVLGLAVASTVSLPAAMLAQTASAQGLEEVVVTARQRSESVQDVPVAITALSEEQLERSYAQDLRDLSARAPNVVFNQVQGFNAASISIRGMATSDIRSTTESAVTVVVDDFYLGHAQSSLLDMFDIEQISILRGPQGTLFGKNTIGGVVQVKTKRPSGEFAGAVEVGLGNYGREDLKLAVDVPIVEDVLAGRFTIMSNESDGYYTNLFNGEDIGADDVLAGRGRLLYTPTERLQVLLSYEYNKDRGDSVPLVNTTSESQLFYPAYPGRGVAGRPLGDPFEVYQNSPADYGLPDFGHDFDIKGYYLNADYELDTGTLTYIAGRRSVDSDLFNSYLDAPAPVYATIRSVYRDTDSHELRFASSYADNYDFVVGAFYQRNEMEYRNLTALGSGHPFAPGVNLNGDGGQDALAWSLFGETNYLLTDQLTLTVGVRYTSEEKEFNLRPLGLAEADRVDVEDDWSNISYRLGLRYTFDNGVMTYATFSTGFKGGGFNEQAGTTVSAATSYDEENVKNFEIGFKSDLLDQKLRVNGAFFYTDYKDLQVLNTVQLGEDIGQHSIFDNVGKKEIWGVELEAEYMPIHNLSLGGTFGYLSSEYKDFTFDVNGVGREEDVSFLDPQFAPEITASLYAQYDWELAGMGFLSFNANMTFTDEFYAGTGIKNVQSNLHEDVTLLNGSVKWSSPSEAYSLALWGRNLTDEEYQVTGEQVANLWDMTAYGKPRTYGVTLKYNF